MRVSVAYVYSTSLCPPGVRQAVQHGAGRPGHARHLRRLPQHRQGGGALHRRQAEDAAGAQEGRRRRTETGEFLQAFTV